MPAELSLAVLEKPNAKFDMEPATTKISKHRSDNAIPEIKILKN